MTAPEPAERGHSDSQRASLRLWFWASVVLVAGWLVALGILALQTANPVTLNRWQLLHSDVVLVGSVSKISANHVASVRVETVLANRRLIGRDDLPETLHLTKGIAHLEPGKTYLLPLSRRESRLEITAAPLAADETWIAYPASPKVIEDAKRILAAQPAKPYP